MARAERIELIRRLESLRGSRVLVYITGDRRGLEAKMATDVFPFILNHLAKIGHQEKLDLFLYSTGGVTMAGYALVNLVREFCNKFEVVVPFKAHSSATLIALGADTIIMSKMGQLSPIDPSVQSPLAPQIQIPGQPMALGNVPVSAEDVTSYLEIAKTELGLRDEDSLVRIFEKLSSSVHPLVLGGLHRVRAQIMFLARNLLAYHMKDEARINQTIETLLRGRFSHDYLIGRREAKDILKLNVVDEDAFTLETVSKLYEEYDKLLQLSTPYSPMTELGANERVTRTFNRAIIESSELTHVFRTTKEITRVILNPPQVPAPTPVPMEFVLEERWLEDNSI